MVQLIKGVVDTQKNSYRSIGQVSAGDDLELELEVKMNGQPIEFINPECELLIKKSDNNKVRQTKDIIYQDGKFKIKVDEQGVTYPGIVSNQLVINDEGRVSTCLFYFNVGASLEREVLQSISKVETLEQLDEYVVTAFSNLDEYETRLTELDGTMKTTNEEITVNESERKVNESERKTNETLRIENEKERVKKENERSEAEIDRKESELDRIKNENARRIAENTRIARENARENAEVNRNAIFEENEVIRNEAEKLREKAEAKRKENFSNLESLNEKLNEAEAERVRAEGNRESKETERQLAESEREKAEANRENTYTNFNDAEVDRRNNENARIQAENLRVQAESIRSERFETAQSTRETKFEESQNTRDELFKASETARATEEIAREKAESIREGNEAIRVNSESLRESAENARQQEEIKRSQAEVLRVEAEKERELSYEEIKKDNSTFKDNINSQYEDIVTEFDKVIANVTNGNENATNSEIVQARGKEVNLNARLDNFDEQLDNKAKQSDLIVERKRIDNLTTLPEGSTMGDAELMDGRIGLGGKIFNNIGDAIRSQFGYINEKSNDLTFNYISGNNETSNLINYVSYYKKGYYVHSNGTENSNSDFAISELIPVTPLATCRFKILSDDATSVQHTGVILDKNGQYIQPLTKLDSITDITEKEIILPSNAYFVRVNLRIGFNKSYFKIVGTKELKWLRICKENLKDDVFFEKNLPWNGKKVTIYGDSLAQINDWAGNTLSWVSFLKEYCGFSEVVNKGIGGTTITPGTREGKTNDFYTRITTQNDIGTHLFIIFGGMNDYLFNSVIGSPNEAPGNTTLCNSVKSICEHIQTRYPESQILFILPPYGVPEPTTTNTIKEVSKAIEESVEDYGVEILNLTKYGDITVKNSAQKSLYYYDGIHYNDKGHERIAKNKIIPKVNSMLIRN